MKILFAALLLFFYSPLLFSQTIEIESAADHRSYNTSTFPAAEGAITVSENQFVLGSVEIANPGAWSLSHSNRRASFLQRNAGVNLSGYTAKGELLVEKILEFFSPADNTMNTYQFDDGKIVLRDNVANFSFLNAKGDLAYSVSNSSGSSEGERESRLAADPSGATIVLYNPVIVYGSQTGSRAKIVYGDQEETVFFSSRNEEIKNISVSDNGAFITVLSDGSQGNRVTVYDRFGNQLFQLTVEEDLVGATLQRNATYLTIYSSGRVQVYEVPGGERLGSASSRSSILYADYDPSSKTIIALGGTLRSRIIEEAEITAVSISQRAIARQEVPFSLSVLDLDRIDISAVNSRKYEISGLNRHLLVDIQF